MASKKKLAKKTPKKRVKDLPDFVYVASQIQQEPAPIVAILLMLRYLTNTADWLDRLGHHEAAEALAQKLLKQYGAE